MAIEKNEKGQFKKINNFTAIEKDKYIVKWLEGIKSKSSRVSLMAKFCEFLGKSPSELAHEHQEDLKLDVLEQSKIAKKQLNNFFGYLTNTDDKKWKNILNKKEIETPIAWNSARQYVFSKLLSFYSRLGIDVKYKRKEKPKEAIRNVREKTWRRNGVDKEGKLVKEMIPKGDKKGYLKQIRDSLNSIRDKAILLCKMSSSLDDIDLFNLTIERFRLGYLPRFEICYLEGERQKDDELYQTFFGTEACKMIDLYLIDRLDKINKSKKKNLSEIPQNRYLFAVKEKKMDARYFTEKMKQIVDKLELYNITPKSIRRFFNSTLDGNSINKGIIGRLMGQKGDIRDEHYNDMFNNAKEGEFEELALYYVNKIDALVSLGNGNKKITEVEKEIGRLNKVNEGLNATIEGLKGDMEDLTNSVNQIKEMIMKGDLSFITPLPNVFAKNQEKETEISRKKHQKAKKLEENLKKA
ncbi:hypothetical protein LCGC14_0789510 [marine sediment metagenome]|uniref:Uncharacterized protein n=1 Tax=marine sediment metagenome TaxID=412755 RepID=A0A0F9QCU3_9ZZZZ